MNPKRQEAEIQRYDAYYRTITGNEYKVSVQKNPDGDYVLWEDIAAALEKAREETLKEGIRMGEEAAKAQIETMRQSRDAMRGYWQDAEKAREEAEADRAKLIDILIEVERWWIEQGMHNFAYGAPHCIFAVRGLLDAVAKNDERRICTTEIKRKEKAE